MQSIYYGSSCAIGNRLPSPPNTQALWCPRSRGPSAANRNASGTLKQGPKAAPGIPEPAPAAAVRSPQGCVF
jgi:hypothetical protein